MCRVTVVLNDKMLVNLNFDSTAKTYFYNTFEFVLDVHTCMSSTNV